MVHVRLPSSDQMEPSLGAVLPGGFYELRAHETIENAGRFRQGTLEGRPLRPETVLPALLIPFRLRYAGKRDGRPFRAPLIADQSRSDDDRRKQSIIYTLFIIIIYATFINLFLPRAHPSAKLAQIKACYSTYSRLALLGTFASEISSMSGFFLRSVKLEYT